MKKTKVLFWGLILLLIVALGGLFLLKISNTKTANLAKTSADQRFGFLVGQGAGELSRVRQTGASWARPHPGAFIWGKMVSESGGPIDFSQSDKLVNQSQTLNLNLLATLFPYRANNQGDGCLINDEFRREFGENRCPPSDYPSYDHWVKALVERYDGDGESDMPGLAKPVKYWEVGNEPDLAPPPGVANGLRFFVGAPRDYGKLLKHTYLAIKSADSTAKVLIAGAGGGNPQFLNFYRVLFSDKSIGNFFDIANVHCISSDDIASFNVAPYKKMLEESGINKPIWVTEAEAFISADKGVNVAQLEQSAKEALKLGAEKIFFTSLDMRQPGNNPPPLSGGELKLPPSSDTKVLVDPIKVYQAIFKRL